MKENWYFNNLLEFIAEVEPYARAKKIRLGFENRMHNTEIPDIDEIGLILEKFPSPAIGFWFDCGHAYIMQKFGIVKDMFEYLERYSSRLVGMHVHDVRGILDHYAPLDGGDVPLDRIKKYVREDTFVTLETQSRSSIEKLSYGLTYIKKLLA